MISVILIRWIVIYPVDSAIQRLNNRGQNLVLWACPKFISAPKRYRANSTITNYITGTAILIVIKITFEHFLLEDVLKVFSQIFILISVLTLAAVILGFSTLSGFRPLKGTKSTPVNFMGEYHRPPTLDRKRGKTDFVTIHAQNARWFNKQELM